MLESNCRTYTLLKALTNGLNVRDSDEIYPKSENSVSIPRLESIWNTNIFYAATADFYKIYVKLSW